MIMITSFLWLLLGSAISKVVTATFISFPSLQNSPLSGSQSINLKSSSLNNIQNSNTNDGTFVNTRQQASLTKCFAASRSSTLSRSYLIDGGDTTTKGSPRIMFPGGGIFFYWQIGAVSHLRRENYNLSQVPLAGASAGALAATLTASDVDFDQATELALNLAEEAGVWDRPLGLQGVWGPLIERWLDELLPDNAADVSNERLALLVTTVPSFGIRRVSNFDNKQDLIKCNMASVHLPWFLDGNLTSDFRNSPHIDGSFLAKPEDYFPDPNNDIITLDWKKDPVMAEKKNDFVKLVSKEGIWSMVDQGREFAKSMEAQGTFDSLPRQ